MARVGGGLSSFLKRTLNFFSESFDCRNDNARLEFGCTQVRESWSLEGDDSSSLNKSLVAKVAAVCYCV